MYKFNRNSQITFSDFNQPLGMKMYREKARKDYLSLAKCKNVLQNVFARLLSSSFNMCAVT